MRVCLFCLAVSSFLFAEEKKPPPILNQSPLVYQYWKFHKYAAFGYQRDRQQFVRHGASPFTQRYFDRNSINLCVGAHIEFNHLVLDVVGGYSWLVNGATDVFDQGEQFSFTHMSLGAGYSALARGVIGMRIHFYDTEEFGLYFIPSGGPGYFHIQNWEKGGFQDHKGVETGTWNTLKPNQQDWFGAVGRFALELRFEEELVTSFFFQYQRPSLRAKFKQSITSGTIAGVSEVTTNSYVIQARSCESWVGGFDLKYHNKNAWTFGLHFEGATTDSNKGRTRLKTVTEHLAPSPISRMVTSTTERTSVHWVNYWVSLFAGYKF